jgi:carboxyl-terminal processing protease
MGTFKQASLSAVLVFAGLIWGLVLGLVFQDFLPRLPYIFRPSGDLTLLQEAYGILQTHALEPPEAGTKLQHGMIRGMLDSYGDPYSSFLEPIQAELEGNRLQGSFGGIGAGMGRDDDGYVVLFPFPDSPAQKAGILEGDRLLKVNDLIVLPELDFDSVLAAVRGPVGQPVSLTVASPPGYDPRPIDVRRDVISLPSVTWHLDPADSRLGVVVVNLIADSSAEEIQKAVDDLQQRGATHFVLDLRNNGGGLLNAGVDVAGLFLTEGEVMRQQYRGQQVRIYQVERPGPLADIPLAVLVNTNTASAAEIIAGALQANGRALLVGTPTYGKNTVQLVFELQDGSSLHVTAARWWFEGLEFPRDGAGLFPDLSLPDGEQDPEAALRLAAGALLDSP